MKHALLAITLSLSPWAHAEGLSGGSAAELLKQTKTPTAVAAPPKSAFQITSSCTDSAGRVHASGTEGYAGCLREPKSAPGKTGSISNHPTIGFDAK